MLVIGTRKEYFNAVWVRNEWSRFQSLMKNDRSRLLIPCYRDMDAYDLPEEMSMLQSQDMSKIGFLQDLIRGIKKVLDASKPIATPASVSAAAPAQVTAASPGIESLIKRGWLFLEDSDWNQANEYFNRVLDINPEYASAYAGKLCAELRIRREIDLTNHTELLENMPNYQKALRFGDEDYRNKLAGINQAIQERLAQASHAAQEAQYDKLSRQLREKPQKITENEYQHIARLFRLMDNYKDAAGLAKECEERALEMKAQREGQQHMQAEKDKKIKQAREWFKSRLCWHCGGKQSVFSRKCKICGKQWECFLCGGQIAFIGGLRCLDCKKDFVSIGFFE
jgi:tetratricopeptide (TPR) repeat protein